MKDDANIVLFLISQYSECPEFSNCFWDDQIGDNHQVGLWAKKEKAQGLIFRWREHLVLSMEHAGMMGSKSVYVGGYFHWSCVFVLFYAVLAPRLIVKKAQ